MTDSSRLYVGVQQFPPAPRLVDEGGPGAAGGAGRHSTPLAADGDVEPDG
jgi:hypothetical protein